ncbi:MAG: ATP-dependent metallopeptidase FtsH/Yme1/Tma family protein [Ignavibacteria bacterium]|nr:ATP-dependent metallopeptidase FtsH/Yme1/Tma family protein [Ignavibacteria bacterium]
MSEEQKKQDNKKEQKNLFQNKGKKPEFKKGNENFDWSKILRLVFGWGGVIVAAIIVMQMFRSNEVSEVEINYPEYLRLLNEDKIESAVISKSEINNYYFHGKLKEEELLKVTKDRSVKSKKFMVFIPEAGSVENINLWKEKKIDFTFEEKDSSWWTAILTILPWIIIFGVWILIMRRMQGGGGGSRGIFNFGKSRAKVFNENMPKVTFKDVAGADEAKYELQEIIEFLKEPNKFQALGGRIPRGVLLLGPPGTGKTLLARAVAGEAGVPFFSISGADFVEMFVGVGASRVRDLFEQGKKSAPCLVFIDEIDAVGRQRGAGLGGGHDEREQTLNQLLIEMDGFEQNSGVIIIAATNRPDILDPALLRPGRFDRQVVVDRPDVKGREGILKVHTRKIPLGPDVDVAVLAKGTPGLSGADLANLVNEAALLAARKSKKQVEMNDFEEAKDKVMMGMERKSLIISEKEKEMTAYHETGHVLVAKMIPEADPVHKVTIIPRGRALGVTTYLPIDEKHTYSKAYLEAMITYALGGRAAELLIFDQLTTGAGNDIERSTQIARKMVCEWGMSEKLGPLAYGSRDEEVFLGREITRHKDFSEKTAQKIDEEVSTIIEKCMKRAEKTLKENINHLHRIAKCLLDREILDGEEIDKLLKGEELPPVVKKENNDTDVPDHVKKLMDSRNPKSDAAESKPVEKKIKEPKQ